ncbi:hypothetical protein L6452_15279 [Arctium lappa]|uniref:Uncharacterized protein n=1 Tax=Arctium lappa TaxID=4217 RepID=A0ACB9CNA9_ARCLA|nr:hypothetical protein L6452_15279 [Arctium lappa]
MIQNQQATPAQLEASTSAQPQPSISIINIQSFTKKIRSLISESLSSSSSRTIINTLQHVSYDLVNMGDLHDFKKDILEQMTQISAKFVTKTNQPIYEVNQLMGATEDICKLIEKKVLSIPIPSTPKAKRRAPFTTCANRVEKEKV